MTYIEATEYANTVEDSLGTKLVRILPETVDPIKPGDNGWDVEITSLDDDIS